MAGWWVLTHIEGHSHNQDNTHLLSAFEFLITLQGMTWEDFDFPLDLGDTTQIERGQEGTVERNKRRVDLIFRQLSYNTGFMSSSLADEGLLLLTEGRLAFASVAACLAHVGMTHTGRESHQQSADGKDEAGNVFTETPMNIFDRNVFTYNPISQSIVLVLGNTAPKAATVGGSPTHHSQIPAQTSTQAVTAPSMSRMVLDWTWFLQNHGWGQLQLEAYAKLAASTGNFIGKTQLIEYFEWFRQVFLGDSELSPVAAAQTEIRQLTSNFAIDFAFFDQICQKLGYSTASSESRQLWALVWVQLVLYDKERAWWKRVAPQKDAEEGSSVITEADKVELIVPTPRNAMRQATRGNLLSYGAIDTSGSSDSEFDLLGPGGEETEFLDEPIPQLLPLGLTANALLRLFLLPLNSAGLIVTLDDTFDSIVNYIGCGPPIMLSKFLMAAKISVMAQGFCCIWENLPKNNLETSEILTPQIKDRFFRRCAAQRVMMESRTKRAQSIKQITSAESAADDFRVFFLPAAGSALDPRKGGLVSVAGLRFELPKFLLQGMWPEAVQSFFELGMNVSNQCAPNCNIQHLVVEINAGSHTDRALPYMGSDQCEATPFQMCHSFQPS
eukprot:Blabericola_migrator_1__3200@NODE_193_length_11571_cov_33_434805_g166_i0_p2_GENE_NODE_193_length_11571_cov_33_434805_g166_i0NODE_193_length_11571_cov_33_434805_g166_i0_p2_ORF_typecomplete_len613_score122_80_NODE_193_length_11571_cov_33_434805_g166_i050036841